MDRIDLARAGSVVRDMIDLIVANRAYLSELDGAIGDGDHGINMAKGFSQCATAMDRANDGAKATDNAKDLANPGLAESFDLLGNILLADIGGSMGPLYGCFFIDMGGAIAGAREMDAALFSVMLHRGLAAIEALGQAGPGDKTLIDTLSPAIAAFDTSIAAGQPFAAALSALAKASEAGMLSTRDLAARLGRAARLGERSRGHIDAGAASCNLLLQAMASRLQTML